MPQNTYDCRLSAVNIVLTLIIVLIPSICWVLSYYPEYHKPTDLTNRVAPIICLAFSCGILIWGFQKLVKSVEYAKDHIVKKTMIGWHILAYLLIIVADIVADVFINRKSFLQYEVIIYFVLVINLACMIILALIIN